MFLAIFFELFSSLCYNKSHGGKWSYNLEPFKTNWDLALKIKNLRYLSPKTLTMDKRCHTEQINVKYTQTILSKRTIAKTVFQQTFHKKNWQMLTFFNEIVHSMWMRMIGRVVLWVEYYSLPSVELPGQYPNIYYLPR